MEARQGFVYLLQPEGHNVYKIGCTVDLEGRLVRLQRRFERKLHYVLVLRSNDYQGFERHLHAKFARKRVVGEWFLLSSEDIEGLRSGAT